MEGLPHDPGADLNSAGRQGHARRSVLGPRAHDRPVEPSPAMFSAILCRVSNMRKRLEICIHCFVSDRRGTSSEPVAGEGVMAEKPVIPRIGRESMDLDPGGARRRFVCSLDPQVAILFLVEKH